jgi:hypothetical protein
MPHRNGKLLNLGLKTPGSELRRNVAGRPACRLRSGLAGVQFVISDACLWLVEAVTEVYPGASWQRCVVRVALEDADLEQILYVISCGMSA